MKPLSAPSCETGNCEKIKLVGILPENPSKFKGWVFVVAPKDLPNEFQAILEGKEPLHISGDRCRQLLQEFQPLRLASSRGRGHHKYLIYDYFGRQLKINKRLKNPGQLPSDLDNFNLLVLPMGPELVGFFPNFHSDSCLASSTSRNFLEDHMDGCDPSSPVGFLLTLSHWKSLVGCVSTWQDRCGSWINKRKKQSCSSEESSDTNNNCSLRDAKPGLLKWITKKKRSSRENGFADEETTSSRKQDGNKKLIKFGKKVSGNLRYGSSGRVGCKAKRIMNLPAGKRKVVKMETAREETEQEDKDKQLIRIELKPDPMIQESSFQFCSGDLLRLRVTIQDGNNCGGLQSDFIAPGYMDYEVEIDFVQHLMCETRNMGGCRNRRITKLLKRTVISELDWERGIKMTGQHFALCWIPYRIPDCDEEAGKAQGLGKLDERFKLAGCQYELQIRFYQKDEEESQYILSACSFTLNLMEEKRTHSGEDNTLSCFGDSGDILQIFQDFDETSVDEGNVSLDAAAVDMLMIETLSVTTELGV